MIIIASRLKVCVDVLLLLREEEAFRNGLKSIFDTQYDIVLFSESQYMTNAEVIYSLFIKRASLNKNGIDYLSIKQVS